jgi:Phycobilisome degradation protein nblA
MLPPLSIEQQLSLDIFKRRIDGLSLEDSRVLLIELYESMLIRETLTKSILSHQWGIGDPTAIPYDPSAATFPGSGWTDI